MRRIGTTTSVHRCDHCGRAGLARTVVFERADKTRVHMGTGCAQRLMVHNRVTLARIGGMRLGVGGCKIPPHDHVEVYKGPHSGIVGRIVACRHLLGNEEWTIVGQMNDGKHGAGFWMGAEGSPEVTVKVEQWQARPVANIGGRAIIEMLKSKPGFALGSEDATTEQPITI